jgi:hypothetical protein
MRSRCPSFGPFQSPDLSLLRLDLNGNALIKLLESESLVTTMSIYNAESISIPRVTMSLNPSLTLESVRRGLALLSFPPPPCILRTPAS